jgi:hypothetical protein
MIRQERAHVLVRGASPVPLVGHRVVRLIFNTVIVIGCVSCNKFSHFRQKQPARTLDAREKNSAEKEQGFDASDRGFARLGVGA